MAAKEEPSSEKPPGSTVTGGGTLPANIPPKERVQTFQRRAIGDGPPGGVDELREKASLPNSESSTGEVIELAANANGSSNGSAEVDTTLDELPFWVETKYRLSNRRTQEILMADEARLEGYVAKAKDLIKEIVRDLNAYLKTKEAEEGKPFEKVYEFPDQIVTPGEIFDYFGVRTWWVKYETDADGTKVIIRV